VKRKRSVEGERRGGEEDEGMSERERELVTMNTFGRERES
jgi:hypothetical protein